MHRGLAREARRRPDMDLLVGPLEAQNAPAPSEPPAEAASPDQGGFEIPGDAEELPAWREDG